MKGLSTGLATKWHVVAILNSSIVTSYNIWDLCNPTYRGQALFLMFPYHFPAKRGVNDSLLFAASSFLIMWTQQKNQLPKSNKIKYFKHYFFRSSEMKRLILSSKIFSSWHLFMDLPSCSAHFVAFIARSASYGLTVCQGVKTELMWR